MPCCVIGMTRAILWQSCHPLFVNQYYKQFYVSKHVFAPLTDFCFCKAYLAPSLDVGTWLEAFNGYITSLTWKNYPVSSIVTFDSTSFDNYLQIFLYMPIMVLCSDPQWDQNLLASRKIECLRNGKYRIFS